MIVFLFNILLTFLCFFNILSCQVSYNIVIEGKTYTVNLMQKQVNYIILLPVFVLVIIIVHIYPESNYFAFVNIFSCLLFVSYFMLKKNILNLYNKHLGPGSICMLASFSFPATSDFYLTIYVVSWRMNFDIFLFLSRHKYDLFLSSLTFNYI